MYSVSSLQANKRNSVAMHLLFPQIGHKPWALDTRCHLGKGAFVLALQWSSSASGLGGAYTPLCGTNMFLSALHLDLEYFFHYVHLPKLNSTVDTFLQLPPAYIVGLCYSMVN